MMELWFTEKQTKDLNITCRVKETLHVERSEYQDIALLDTGQFGRMLVLDGAIQTTVKDEFVYHEMISHIPLFTHPNPKRVAVIGGGDGGTIREILKHKSVEKATLVEIDKRVVEVAKKYLPEISVALDDSRAEVRFEDGIEFVKNHRDEFDVIMVDSTDPVGPAVGLFVKEFYQSIHGALKEDGIFVAQTESPFYNGELIASVYRDVSSVFPIAKVFLCNVPTYPGGLWCFTLGSKKYDPEEVEGIDTAGFDCKYYSQKIHKAAFALPPFAKKYLE
jgi:spermidine synthase